MPRFLAAFSILLLLPSSSFAAINQGLKFSTINPYQGEVIIITLPGSAAPNTATLGSYISAFFPYQNSYRAIIPIASNQKPGPSTLTITLNDQSHITETITVRAKKFPVVILPVPEKLQQTPQQLTQNLTTQNADIKTLVAPESPTIFFSSPFGLPLVDNRKIGSVFGEIRKTGTEEIRHLGTDFTAKTGTTIGAINSGIVTKAYLDPIYGNSIVIDHGLGIYSLYMHLDSMKVKTGEHVNRGTLIGRVGQTGYASAPHLHLSIKIKGVSIDPLQFIGSFK